MTTLERGFHVLRAYTVADFRYCGNSWPTPYLELTFQGAPNVGVKRDFLFSV
jgi:hypothetical protein